MFKKVKLENGKWIEVSNIESLENLRVNDENTYVFYTGELSEDISEQNKLIEDVFKANGNKINRVTIGLNMCEKDEVSPSSCPGRCFCVVEGGSRRCETYYCNSNGYCWWVPCGMGC